MQDSTTIQEQNQGYLHSQLLLLPEKYHKHIEALAGTYDGEGSSISNGILAKEIKQEKSLNNELGKALVGLGLAVKKGGKTSPRLWSSLDSNQAKPSESNQAKTKPNQVANLDSNQAKPSGNTQPEKIEYIKNNNLVFGKKDSIRNATGGNEPTRKTPLALRERQCQDNKIRKLLIISLTKSKVFYGVVFSLIEASEMVSDVENTFNDVGLVFKTYQSNCVVDLSLVDSQSGEHFTKTVLPIIENLGLIKREVNGYRWFHVSDKVEVLRNVVNASIVLTPSEEREEKKAVIQSQGYTGRNISLTKGEKKQIWQEAEELTTKLRSNAKNATQVASIAAKWIRGKIGTTENLEEKFNQNNKKKAA